MISSPATAGPAAQEQAIRAAIEAELRGIQETFGRTPLMMGDLLKLLNQNEWPRSALVHPLDFFLMIRSGIPVHKDQDGPYFYLSCSKIRPGAPADETLDLTDWEPNKITLAAFGG